jgi:glucosylceramidase
LTAQNEPTDGNIDHFPFQATGWTPEQQRDFITKDLGPELHANGYGDVKLMMLDDQRLLLAYWADTVIMN